MYLTTYLHCLSILNLYFYSGFAFVTRPGILKSRILNRPNEIDRNNENRNELLTIYGKKKKKSLESEEEVVAKREFQHQEALASTLLDLCTENVRNVNEIEAAVNQLKLTAIKPAQSASLSGSWRLIFVSNAEIIGCIGTGLHKLPLTRMEDTFVTFKPNTGMGREIELIEVLRIMGPFPNVKNTLSGTYKSEGTSRLLINYTSMIDGTGKTVTSGNPAMDGNVSVDVLYVGNEVMVMSPKENVDAKEVMVFTREVDLEGELKRLRL